MSAAIGGDALYDCRDAFAETLLELVAADDRGSSRSSTTRVGSTKVSEVRKVFPDRVINVGIAEQDLVGVGAGLANGGRIPFVCAASPFLTGRALEQIKVDVAYSRANVKLVGVSTGVAYGELGPTHHSIEDLAWTRAIADLTVVVPADPIDTAASIRLAHDDDRARCTSARAGCPSRWSTSPGYQLRFGPAATLRDGTDVTSSRTASWSTGRSRRPTLLAADGISARVLDMATVSPIDGAAIVRAARETGGIVTAEEHTVRGGLGGAVAEVVVTHHPVPMRILGFSGISLLRARPSSCWSTVGLTATGIRDAALAIVHDTAVTADLILAIDQGTTNTKACLVDRAGQVVASSSVRVPVSFPRPGWVESDPLELWDTVARAIDECLGRADVARVAAVAVANQRESVLVWERASGRPLGPVVGWQCRRSTELCERTPRRGRRGTGPGTHGPAARPDVLGDEGTLAARPGARWRTRGPSRASCASARSTPGSSGTCRAGPCSRPTPPTRPGRCCSTSTDWPGTPSAPGAVRHPGGRPARRPRLERHRGRDAGARPRCRRAYPSAPSSATRTPRSWGTASPGRAPSRPRSAPGRR